MGRGFPPQYSENWAYYDQVCIACVEVFVSLISECGWISLTPWLTHSLTLYSLSHSLSLSVLSRSVSHSLLVGLPCPLTTQIHTRWVRVFCWRGVDKDHFYFGLLSMTSSPLYPDSSSVRTTLYTSSGNRVLIWYDSPLLNSTQISPPTVFHLLRYPLPPLHCAGLLDPTVLSFSFS